jgi:hypothetical protein
MNIYGLKGKKIIHKGNKQNKWNDNIKVNLWTKLNITIEEKTNKAYLLTN